MLLGEVTSDVVREPVATFGVIIGSGVIGRVVMQVPDGGGYYECAAYPHAMRDRVAWRCGRCGYDFASDGFLATGMACSRCGAVVVAIRAGVNPTADVFMTNGGDRPQTWSHCQAAPFTRETLESAIATLHAMTREQVAALEAQCTGPETCAARHVHALSPSDLGLPNAIPLQADEWHPAFTDEGWAEQNRKINDLLMGPAR